MLSLLSNYSTKECQNDTETLICKAILENLPQIHQISSEKLAQLSNTSVSSITRLVRKFPVKSYKEMAKLLYFDYQRFEFARQRNTEIIDEFGIEGIIENTKERYETNLYANQIQDQEIEKLIHSVQYAKSITFIGAMHSLEIFSKVQIALLQKKKRAYIFKQEGVLKEHLSNLDQNDLAIFISLEDRYLNTLGKKHLSYLRNNHIPCILLSQSKHDDENLYQQVIYFGKDQDWNYGYYSMDMLANHLTNKISNM